MKRKLALACLLALLLSTAGWLHPAGAGTARVARASSVFGAWTVYHHDNGHTGYDPSLPPAVVGARAGWTSPILDQQVYGEPLVYGGLVYTATLNNTVYALDQATGTVTWSTNLGAPETTGWVCGNVSPQGIIGTPVIDAAAGRIYVVTLLGSDDLYRLVGLNLATGAVVLTTVIPNTIGTGFDWKIQQQRGALGLGNGYVYVPFGGRAGDCFDNGGSTPYYGWVVGVPTSGSTSLAVYQTPSGGSGVWAAGGVLVDDNTHDVIFATGNAIPCSGSTYSDAVVRVSPTLTGSTFFEPADWQSNWCGPDLDLGSASPVIINNDLLFTAGKHGGGFLLDQNNLGGVDGQLFPSPVSYAQADVCLGNHSDATFGSFAYAAPDAYLECDGHGVVGLHVTASPPSFGACGSSCPAPDWQAGGTGTYGPPIVAGGVVWAIDTNGTGLWGWDAATGSKIFQSASFGANRFVTPSEAGGQVFVPARNVILSFNLTFAGGTRSTTGSPGGATPGARAATPAPSATPGGRLGLANGAATSPLALQPPAASTTAQSGSRPWRPGGHLRAW